MKKAIKYFVMILISAFAMLFVMQTNVSANYDPAKNYTNISLTRDAVTITVNYQRGFSGSNHSGDTYAGSYVWCDVTYTNRCDKKSDNSYNFVSIDVISESPSSYADNNPQTKTFVIDNKEDPILKNVNFAVNKEYKIFVTIYFCSVREKNGTKYGACKSWDNDNENSITVLEVSGNDLALKNGYEINTEIGDEKISGLMGKITEIVYNIVLPVIWGLLGVFLIVKGSILGTQIVKSADSPEVRQAKIGSLKWLLIGVAVAYGSTAVIKALEDIIKGLLAG